MIIGDSHIAPAETKGFDCNRPPIDAELKKLFDLGYRFAVRYVPRITWKSTDLSAKEIEALFLHGLAVMAVQHVESEDSWLPDSNKGSQYGLIAGQTCARIGLAQSTMCWLDLEGVAANTPAAVIVSYCNNWHIAVADLGFTPGLYVGWHAGLNAQQLYGELRFEHYWGAYNLDKDQEPLTRGIQMKQSALHIPGLDLALDGNVIMADKLGSLPIVHAPEEWAVE